MANRSIEPNQRENEPYFSLLNSNLLQCIYLDELNIIEESGLGLMIIQLVVVAEKQVSTQVAKLMNRVQQLTDETQQQAINLIETIILYKLPTLSQEELQAMLGIEDLKKTRFAQEMIAEGRLG